MNDIIRILSIYLFVGVLQAAFLAAYAVTKGNTRVNRIFAALSGQIAIFLFGYVLELNSTTLEQMIFWNQVQLLPLPFYPAFWLFLAIAYTDRRGWRNKTARAVRWLIFVVPVLSFLIRLTNDYHHLYYSTMTLGRTAGFPVMLLGKGPWYYVNWIYVSICLVLATYFYLRRQPIPGGTKNGQYLMLVSSIIPYLGMILILTNPFNCGLDFAALLLPISVSICMVALFRYDFLAVRSLARDIVFENSHDAMILIDARHQLKDSNNNARVLLPEIGRHGHGDQIEMILRDRPELLSIVKNEPTSARPTQVQINDSYYEVEMTSIQTRTGQKAGTLVSLSDVTDRRIFQEKLKTLATRDGLTGLNNRAHFLELAELARAQAAGNGQPATLFMFDIDHFKVVNDTYGHAAGDLVLKTLGEKMRSFFRISDILGRLGGEEFAVFLQGASLAHAQLIIERFREAVARTPIIFDGHEVNITLSLGAAEMGPLTKDLDELLKLADKALYQAKRDGRNCLRLAP